MNIKAQTTYNLKVFQGLSRMETFKGRDPKKVLVALLVILTVAVAVILVLGFLVIKETSFLFYALIPGGLAVMLLYEYYVSPWYKYKSADKLADLNNTFIFGEEEVEMISEAAGYHGRCKISYDSFYKVAETNTFIFLYQDRTKIFVVDKDVVDDEDEKIIRARIKKCIGDRYTRCKY